MKRFTLVLFLCIFGLINAAGQDSRAAFALNHYAARNFTAGALSAAELDTVIQAGIRAPSARNRQPWHFTVVRDRTLANKIISNVPDGNVLIIVSAAGDGKTNGSEILDCGLAVESMYLAAQAAGLGSRIYTGPMDAINKGMKAELGFPPGYSAVALVRIGKVQAVDAVSAASDRGAASRMVTYK
jgi:nitroreductase